jgi:hypothetical protein
MMGVNWDYGWISTAGKKIIRQRGMIYERGCRPRA